VEGNRVSSPRVWPWSRVHLTVTLNVLLQHGHLADLALLLPQTDLKFIFISYYCLLISGQFIIDCNNRLAYLIEMFVLFDP
jgi:hypothetical protein